MRKIFLTGPRQLELRGAPFPDFSTAGPHDVLINVASVGLCGSDLHYYRAGRIGSQVVEYPFCIGHEFAGHVLATGGAVENLAVGDRVAVDPAIPCLDCDQCRANRRHTCRRLLFLGCPGQREGCLRDQIIMPAHCCMILPDNLTCDDGALLEPLAIGLYTTRLAPPFTGRAIAILGAGPVGLSTLIAARAQNPARVDVSEPLECRRAVAMQCGATRAAAPDVFENDARGAHEYDVVFECSGDPDAVRQALRALAPGGALVLVGIPETNPVPFDMDLMRRKEITLRNVRRQNNCAGDALKLFQQDPSAARAMLTHAVEPADCAATFRKLDAYSDNIIKAIVRFA